MGYVMTALFLTVMSGFGEMVPANEPPHHNSVKAEIGARISRASVEFHAPTGFVGVEESTGKTIL